MYLRTSRRRWSVLAVLGCCLGAYIVLAVAFHWLVEPTVGKSYAAYAPPRYQPPTAAARGPSAAAAPAAAAAPVAPAALAVAPESRVSAAFAAVADVAQTTAEEKTTDLAPKDAANKDASKKHAAHPRHERSARHARNPWDFAASLFSGSRRWF